MREAEKLSGVRTENWHDAVLAGSRDDREADTEASESELLIVDRELAKLVNLLKERDRGDGKGIVNAERWDRFFGRDDAA